MKVIFVLLFVVVVVVPVYSHFNYCEIPSCKNGTHTLCQHQDFSPSSKCRKVLAKGLTREEKYAIIKLHDELRKKVYDGLETRGLPGPQPGSSSDPKMEWDDELAMIAQVWANQCTDANDECRNVGRFTVGQNIAFDSVFGNHNLMGVENFIQTWYKEVNNYRRFDVKSYSNYNGKALKTQKYTQMIWGNSTKIGCGGIKYYDVKRRFLFVCNYGPAGNIEGEPVYKLEKIEKIERNEKNEEIEKNEKNEKNEKIETVERIEKIDLEKDKLDKLKINK